MPWPAAERTEEPLHVWQADLWPLRRDPVRRMTPEQQEGYRSLIETRGPLGGRRKIWVHNPSWITRAECDRIVDTFGRALATLDLN
jgi:hypothetical protein